MQSINTYSFGAVQIGKRGMACHYPMEKLMPKIQALTIEQAREAYKDARKQLRDASAAMNRYHNVSIHGWGLYERAAQRAYMADLVLCALREHFSKKQG